MTPVTTEERTSELEFRHGVLYQKWLIRTFEGGYWIAQDDEWRPIPGQASRCPGHQIDYTTGACTKCGGSSTVKETA